MLEFKLTYFKSYCRAVMKYVTHLFKLKNKSFKTINKIIFSNKYIYFQVII
jgi:hypothetical protein